MAQYLVERRLMDVSRRLRKTREELAIADEQLMALAEAADEARLGRWSQDPVGGQGEPGGPAPRRCHGGSTGRAASQVKRLEHELDELLASWYPGTPVSSHYRGSQ